MNQRIRELEKQSLDYYWSLDDCVRTTDTFTANPEFTKKFAELIVRECMSITDKCSTGPAIYDLFADEIIAEHFGVEE